MGCENKFKLRDESSTGMWLINQRIAVSFTILMRCLCSRSWAYCEAINSEACPSNGRHLMDGIYHVPSFDN